MRKAKLPSRGSLERKIYDKIYHKEYRTKNKTLVAERKRRWEESHAQELKEKRQRYYIDNKDAFRVRAAAYYRLKCEEIKQRVSTHRRNNPDKDRLCGSRKRARKKRATPPNVDWSVVLVFYETAVRVGSCIGIQFDVDHIVPISKGGLHHQSNLQVLPWRINNIKRAREDFILPWEEDSQQPVSLVQPTAD